MAQFFTIHPENSPWNAFARLFTATGKSATTIRSLAKSLDDIYPVLLDLADQLIVILDVITESGLRHWLSFRQTDNLAGY